MSRTEHEPEAAVGTDLGSRRTGVSRRSLLGGMAAAGAGLALRPAPAVAADLAVKAAKDKFAKAKTAKEKKAAELDVVKHQQELLEAQVVLDLVPPAIQKAMNLKHP